MKIGKGLWTFMRLTIVWCELWLHYAFVGAMEIIDLRIANAGPALWPKEDGEILESEEKPKRLPLSI